MTVSIIYEHPLYYVYSNTWAEAHIVTIQSFSRFSDVLDYSTRLLKQAEDYHA